MSPPPAARSAFEAALPLRRAVGEGAHGDGYGPVFFMDIDNTYLQTNTRGLHNLARRAWETAQAKQPVPGMPELIRALRAGPGGEAHRRLFFVSASPPLMEKVLRERLRLDRIEYDGLCFKDQWQHIKGGEIRRLRRQAGYKLTALLLYARELAAHEPQILIGDDLEQDAGIYATYAEAVAGRLEGAELERRLEVLKASPDEHAAIGRLLGELPRADRVQAIGILGTGARQRHLQAAFPPYLDFGPGASDHACRFFGLGLIDRAQAEDVFAACGPAARRSALERAEAQGQLRGRALARLRGELSR